jgi:hypothetical protein
MNDPKTCEEWLDALSKSLAMDEWHVNQLYLASLDGEACHTMEVHHTYLRSQICLIHSLACKTSSHQVAWWRYRQVDHWCPHFQLKCPLLLVISNEVMMDIYVLSSCMLNRIVGELHGTLIVHSNGTCLNLIPKSFKVAFIQRIYAWQLPAAMYLASTVKSGTLFCFFDDQDTSDLLNSWHVPEVLLLSTLHPA